MWGAQLDAEKCAERPVRLVRSPIVAPIWELITNDVKNQILLTTQVAQR